MEYTQSVQDPGRSDGELKVYKRRWYVLIMYSMYAFTQSAVWNTWGPISTSSEDAFGWDDFTIAWLTNWGPITYLLTGLFYPWLLQVKGLRWATLSSMFFVAAGTACRVITSNPSVAIILIHIGQFLNGVGGPISTGSIPALSSTWFPPHERVTATALSNSINNLGSAVTFILGPALVSSPNNASSSSHHSFLLGALYFEPRNIFDVDNKTAARQSQERAEIMKYMYYVCGWSVLFFLIMLCYFPSKPQHPPCVSATIKRTQYWQGLWYLRTKGYFLIITLSYGVSTGVMSAWASVISMNLVTVNVDEETAGSIGFYSTLAGCAASLLVGRFADRFVQYMKLYILIMYVLATIALVLFTLMLINIIPSSLVGYYVTVIAANALINAAVPLMYELACELAFPTSEAAANGLLTFFSSIWGLIFLCVFFIRNVGTMWMNWTVIASTAVCIPLIALIKGRFNRLECDEGVHTEDYTEQEVLVSEQDGIENPLLVDNHVHTDHHVETVVTIPTHHTVNSHKPYTIQIKPQANVSRLVDSTSESDANASEDDRVREPLLPHKRH